MTGISGRETGTAAGSRGIRKMTAEDLPAVAELERICFAEPWSEKSLELLLTDGARGVVLTELSRVIAYGGMLLAPGEGQITNIAVHPGFRRRGAGREVLNALLTAARDAGTEAVFLEVRISNTPAVALYTNAGFEIVGTRRNFYRFPTEDAYVMKGDLEAGKTLRQRRPWAG